MKVFDCQQKVRREGVRFIYVHLGSTWSEETRSYQLHSQMLSFFEKMIYEA